jgi:hypothetical protein
MRVARVMVLRVIRDALISVAGLARNATQCGVKMPHKKATVARLISPALASILLLAVNLPARADFTIAKGGKARCVIVQQPGATLAESNAVHELAETLGKITGANFQIQVAGDAKVPKQAIVVGQGAAARALLLISR